MDSGIEDVEFGRILVVRGAALCIFHQMTISEIPWVVSAWEDIRLSYGHSAVENLRRAVKVAFGYGLGFSALNGTEQAICRQLAELVTVNVDIMASRSCGHTFIEHMAALVELYDYFNRPIKPMPEEKREDELTLTPSDREFLSGLRIAV